MRGPALALDQAPALAVTLPFLLVAPVFGIAAGALLAVLGPAALESRWTPGALALTHLLTTGLMLQAMCGALLQFAPVAIGVRFWRPRLVARVAQPLMLVGAALLAWALGSGHGALVTPAGLLLGAGIGLFMLSLAIGLWNATGQWRAAWPLWVSMAALAMTVTLGLLLALALGGRMAVPLIPLANLHALWGLAGWSLVLLISVSAIVVPMLQVTPRYPAWLQRTNVGLILALLATSSLPGAGASSAMLAGLLALAAASHAVWILLLQARTRRPRARRPRWSRGPGHRSRRSRCRGRCRRC